VRASTDARFSWAIVGCRHACVSLAVARHTAQPLILRGHNLAGANRTARNRSGRTQQVGAALSVLHPTKTNAALVEFRNYPTELCTRLTAC